MERLSPKTIFKTNICSFIGISLRPLPITFVPLTEEEEEEKKEGNCVEVEENEEDGEEQKDGKEDDAEEEGKDEAKEIGEEFVEKENIEECDLGEVVVEDERGEDETTLKHKREKTVEQNEKNNSDHKKEERENDEDESDEEALELLYGDIDDTVKDNLPKDQQVKIVSNYPNSDDDDEEEEGKLVISEDSDDEEDEMPAAKRAKVSDYTLEESKDRNESSTAATDKETAEDEDNNKTEPSEDVPEKAPAFGFRFVNECLDEEGLEMEEAAILDGHKDAESHVEIENVEIDQNEVDSLEKEEENTMEENVEMSDKNEIQEVTEKLPEVIQKSEILLEDVEEDEEEDEISSESLSTRWQRNKRKRFVQKQRNLIKKDNSSSKRPRRSCQLAKDYFGK